MDKRIFVEKKADFRVKSHSLVKELQHNLQLKTLKDLRIVQVYDVFNLAEDLFARAEKHIFSEQVTDTVLDEAAVKADLEKYAFFAIESLPGQFDQRAASSQEALLLLGSSNDVTVNTAQLYLVNKDIAANELEAVKNYLLNPVDSRFKDITVGIAKQDFSESDKTIPNLDFFETYTAEDFAKYKAEQGLAMEVDDLLFIQDYFKSIGRVPTETELKVLDTYWSDHCRHTTFETELKNIDFSASKFQKQLQATYDKYIAMRDELGRTEKPQTLMDMATIFGRYERANGRLDDMEVSDEINACSVEIEVDVNGVKEPWLLMFKNETHNHPTEIEPFGGAATYNLFKKLDTFSTLEKNNIVPSVDNSYSLEQIEAALSKDFEGKKVFIGCDRHNSLNEIWYYNHLKGSLLSEMFVPMDSLAIRTNCKKDGIKFFPKGYVPTFRRRPNKGARYRGVVRLSNINNGDQMQGFLINS